MEEGQRRIMPKKKVIPKTKRARTIRIPACTLPIAAEADVVVIGGGTAGFVAAIAAARTGAHTILIERQGYLGGALTGTYCTGPGFFGDSENHQIIKGIGWEVMERMEKAGAAIIDREHWRVQMFPEAIKAIALDMVEEAGATLFLHTWASELLVKNNVIEGVVIQSKSGRQVVTGKTFVDATGDADIVFMAGAPTEKLGLDKLWQTSVDLMVCNVDSSKIIQWAKDNSDRILMEEAPKDVDNAVGVRSMVSFIVTGGETKGLEGEGGIQHVGPMPTVKLLIRRSISRVQGSVEIDGTDVRELTYAETEARRRATEHLAYLRKTVPGYEDAFVIGESYLGVRETRRIIGEYVLSVKDLLNNARFSDVVALNCRALDRHTKGEVFEITFLQGNHDIPLRALTPKKVENLLVAGRCISSDHDANASLRGAATCLATGHAAGTAAALAAKEKGIVSSLDVQALQRILRKQEVILST
jgi:ribulose 1,5-bisphosphate synthetase/thiazole synthase